MDDNEKNRIQLNIQQEYADFLDDGANENYNIDRIKEMIKKEKVRLVISINELRRVNEGRCNALLENGQEELPLLQRALREVVSSIDSEYSKKNEEFFIGLEGSFGSKHVTPRSLGAKFLGNVVCLEGIVTKCSTIHPKIVRSVHYCPTTKKTMERKYTDITSSDMPTSINLYPTKDDNGNLLETEFGLSRYRDHQTITIQEMPEKAPTGQLPRALDIVVEDDLVDVCKPGDRVLIVGVYRCSPGKHGGFTSGVFKSLLLANNILLMTKDANLRITKEDVTECKKFSKTSNPFSTLARSLAPSIHGHEFIKKAVLCLLLGGVEKILPNGTRLRGDINVLLIGDPSVAKSQMLRYVGNVAPRVVLTTGRGSSGVGLTAAVTTDGESGERRLEAGAMVLADRGIVCIDEFDKMSDADRTSIHEVMEQGRVTIAKAGIHARLNARTAVLAAANPVYGRYDEYKSPMENIGLQDSLLSRFDLLFIVLDIAEPELDRAVADHVLRMHRYRKDGEQDGEPTPLFMNQMALSTGELEEPVVKERTNTYEKHDALLHGAGVTRSSKILSIEFMKKYIHIAKCIKPSLTSEASLAIAEEYTRLRSLNTEETHMARTQPITARTLETLIRLATAHARARMSKTVGKQDALQAIELVQYAYFKKVVERRKSKKRQRDEDDGGEGEAEEDEEMDVDDDIAPKRLRSAAVNGAATENGENGHSEPPSPAENGDEVAALASALTDHPSNQPAPNLEQERLTKFKRLVANLFSLERTESLPLSTISEHLQGEGFTEAEVVAGLRQTDEDGLAMESDGVVFWL